MFCVGNVTFWGVGALNKRTRVGQVCYVSAGQYSLGGPVLGNTFLGLFIGQVTLPYHPFETFSRPPHAVLMDCISSNVHIMCHIVDCSEPLLCHVHPIATGRQILPILRFPMTIRCITKGRGISRLTIDRSI